ncbi:MAG: DNA (cytosine-5-)-methyltransferase [Eubacteriaceae bacterium]
MEYVIDKNEVHAIMEKKKLRTQSELAERLGVTKNQLSVILSAKTNPFKSNYQKLCDILEIEPVEILKKKETVIRKKTVDKSEEQLQFGDFVDVSTVKAKRNYRSLELFAGAGGLALGLEKAGFEACGLVEIDKYAAATLRKNRPDWNVIEDDIVKVSEVGIKNYLPDHCEIDFISGGYPCQAFSYAGHKLGLDDVRGTMFFYFAKIISDLMPKVFLAENVKGLTTHDQGKTLKTMISIYEKMGYKVCHYVLKANNYGVAQKRERVVIIGIRNDLKLSYRLPKEYDYKPVLRDALKNVPDSIGEKYPPKKHDVLELVPPGGYWRDLPEDIAKDYMGKSYFSGGGRTGMARRIAWDEPSLTLTCSPAQKQTERCHPDETRPFTVREYARIQSFPDDWDFSGSMSQQYKQIGNAVPVEFAKAVGLSIIDVLNRAED